MIIKRILSLFIALATLIILPSCQRTADNISSSTGRDDVVIAIGTEPDTLDPTQGWGHGNSPIVQSTLVRYNADLSFEFDLATEYYLSEDRLKWTFKIRDDAYFTDGEKLTADDVVFTLETAKNSRSSVDLTYMLSAEATDANTVVITLAKPCSIFLNTLASIGIVPKHAYSENYGRAPIGSGPYKFVEWRAQEQIIFSANENYYGDIPSIKNVTVVFMSEDAAFAAVQAGQVDVAYTSATIGGKAIPGYRLESIASADNRGFTLPMLPDAGKTTESGAPIGNNVTCNLEIRQAIAYAIDRNQIVEYILKGFGRPAYSENDGMPWNNPEVQITTNIDYAKKLLSDAGWRDSDNDGILEKNGTKAEFNCLYPSGDSERQAIALAAAQQLEQIGIKINVEGTSWDEITRRMFSEAVMMGWGSAIPNETYYLYHSEGALKDDFYNPEAYMSPVTDQLLTSALEARTPDEANRYWQLVQWDENTGIGASMRGLCPWVWIVNLDHITYVRDGLSIGEQPIHGHGHGLPLIQNLEDWFWNEA